MKKPLLAAAALSSVLSACVATSNESLRAGSNTPNQRDVATNRNEAQRGQ